MSSWAIVALFAILVWAVLKYQGQRRDERMGVTRDHTGEPIQQVREERDEAQRELAELKERVKVLERIATDPARRTAEEIEKLRDD